MELNSLFAGSKFHDFAGKKIEIKQVTLEDLPIVVEMASKFFEKSKASTQEKLMKLIKEDFNSIVKLISKLTDIPADQVNKISLATTVFVVQKILEDNKDFLEQAVAPLLKEAASSLSGMSKSKS